MRLSGCQGDDTKKGNTVISMTSIWQFPPFILIGLFLGILGILYLIYNMTHRWSPMLHRCVFIVSAGLLFAGVQSMSYLFLIAPQRLSEGNPSLVGYSVSVFSIIGLMMLSVFSSALPQRRPSGVSGIHWLNALGSMALSSVGLVGLGAVAGSPGSSPMMAVIFALPGILVMGLVNGFSPSLQWWLFHLPRKGIMVVGTLLILCGLVLITLPLLFKLLGISL